jgi:L-aspartate oxidase
MGGIKTNLNGETSIKGLFAIGETASTGLHGANRLASNSLLECVVCAQATAEYLKNKEILRHDVFQNDILIRYSGQREESQMTRGKLQEIMWTHVGIVRSEESLKTAMQELEKLHSDDFELRNMIDVAKIIVRSALARKESRGAHFRTDFPEANDECIHSTIQGENFADQILR